MGDRRDKGISRRDFIRKAAAGAGGLAIGGCTKGYTWEEFFQKNFKEMSPEEVKRTIRYYEEKYARKYGVPFTVKATPAMEGVVFAYALDLSRCIGCRRCVYGCVKENNLSRHTEIQYIRVLRFRKGEINLEHSEHYFEPEKVPEEGYYYMPVQCQQCGSPPCVKVCPTQATWQEPDGIVVVDYNWCIGCRACMAACPYRARKFNWKEPEVPRGELNTETHYLGNRPRMAGCVEKCTFCIQRARQGRYPACVEACPVGVRKFGNLLDPKSEIRYILDNFRVYRLKEELNTDPRFFYFFSIGWQ